MKRFCLLSLLVVSDVTLVTDVTDSMNGYDTFTNTIKPGCLEII